MSGDFNPGQPLSSYRGICEGVELYCQACALTRVFPLEAVMRAVAKLTTEPCPRCGEKRFESRPAFTYRPNP